MVKWFFFLIVFANQVYIPPIHSRNFFNMSIEYFGDNPNQFTLRN